MKPAYAVQLAFLAALLGAFSIHAADCNRNGSEDVDDIAAGTSADCNQDGVPDECEFVPLEFGFQNQSFLIGQGPQVTVVADLNADGRDDLVTGNQVASRESSVSVLLGREDTSFEIVADYPVPPSLSALAAADLDGDGDIDLVTAHSTELVVLRNAGDGSLGPPSTIAVTRFTRFVTAADLTGDGLPELVTANTSSDQVTVLENLGGASFAAPVSYAAGERPVQIATTDVDGDQDVDLVTLNRDSRTLSTLINDGAGGLRSGPGLLLDARPESMVVGDMDGDALVDFLIIVTDGFSFIRNAGDGGFEPPLLFDVIVRSISLGDLDGDGDLDLAAAAGNGRSGLVFGNPGDGNLMPAAVFNSPVRLTAVGDFDGDADVDVAFANENPDRVTVLWNREEGTVPVESSTFPSGGFSHALTLGDYDADGDVDVALVNGPERTVSLLWNRGDGSFGAPLLYTDIGEGNLHHVITEDIDADGDPDLLICGREQNDLMVFFNQGDGTFADLGTHAVGNTPNLVAAADLDGDADLDLASSNGGSDDVSLLFGDGTGSFGGRVDLPVGSGPRAVAIGDLDADGRNDLVSVNLGSSDLSILRGTGGGDFEVLDTVPTPRPSFVILEDVDADGDLDVVTANFENSQDPGRVDSAGTAGVFLNEGDGTLAPQLTAALGHTPWSITAADLDADGRLDLVSTSAGGNNAAIVVGNGDGTFSPPVLYTTGFSPRFIRTADLDGDGALDLISSDRISETVTVFLNRSAGSVFEGDSLTTICTDLDFFKVSLPAALPPLERVAQYILPASDDAQLLPPQFPNTSRFPNPAEFLPETFPERFGDLDAEGYADLVLRRATREHYVGAVSRLRLEDGSRAYGFDVTVDPGVAAELPSLAEVEDVFRRLSAVFELEPLVYLPSTKEAKEAAALWENTAFTVVVLQEDPSGPGEEPGATPTFELDILEGTELCAGFAERGADRGPRDEYELKSRVRLREGVISLPTENERFSGELIEEVVFGPERMIAQSLGAGEFRVLRIPGEVTTFRFTYAEVFSLPASSGGAMLEIEIVSPLIYRARGEEPLASRQVLPAGFFVSIKGFESLQGRLDGRPKLRYGSCFYPTLPLWNVDWQLADGTTVHLQERYEEAESLFETAPATVVLAEVSLAGGESREVRDYFDLVYSSRRHNVEVDYWVVLDPPLSVAAVVEPVHGIVLQAPGDDRPTPTAAYLGADLMPLAAIEVADYSRSAAPETATLFLRGDANADGRVNIADPIRLVDGIFRRGLPFLCDKAADANDDGRLNVADPVELLTRMFRPPEPAAALETCGRDATEDGLTCASFPVCR